MADPLANGVIVDDLDLAREVWGGRQRDVFPSQVFRASPFHQQGALLSQLLADARDP